MSMMKRTRYLLTQILLHRAVVHAWKRKLRIQYLLRKAIALDDDRNMKSEVHKSHHHSRHRHHERHSKHKRRQENSSKTCSDDASPVLPAPSDSSGSERCFPLTKDHCDVSGSESPENNVALKRRQRDVENTRCEVMTISDSDSDNNGEGDEDRAKRRKKQRHKEKKKRKHGKKQRMEENHTASHFSEQQRKRVGESDSDHSPDRQHEEQMLVRVKQEPLSSDEDTRRRQRTKDHKPSSDVRDGNWHSSSGRDNLRPDRRIKEEPRDRSSSRERKPRPDQLRHSKPERRNGSSEDYRGHRDRRNGRVNGETSSSIKTERDDDYEARDRDRRNRNTEREERKRDHRDDSREGPRRIKRERPTEDDGEYEWGKSDNRQGPNNSGAPVPAEDKKKPNFGLSGKLTEDVNVYNGVVIKYSEPPEARKPKRRWRFYPFKGDETLPTLYLHRQSAFLIGRDRKVADIPVDHPSCSKQHAALQYRLVPFTREDGTKGKRVRPYIIDLDSANGTYVNNKRIEPRKYVELMERDVIKFGYSSRDYVLLHEHSKGDEEDDDQNG